MSSAPGRRSASHSSSGEGSPTGGAVPVAALKLALHDAEKQASSPAAGESSWLWPSRPWRYLGLMTVLLLGLLNFTLVVLLLQGGRGGNFLALRGAAVASLAPSAAACMCNEGRGNTSRGNTTTTTTSLNTPIDPSILARRAAFMPACESTDLPGTGWGPMVFKNLPGGGLKPASKVTVAPPEPDFITDYISGGPPMSAVLKGVCIETIPTFRYVFVGRDASWLDESPELKLSGEEWKDIFDEALTPVLRFSPSAKALSSQPLRWVPGVTMKVRVRSVNPAHHMMESILHESAVQAFLQDEYKEEIGGKIEHFLADTYFNLAMDASFALNAHLTRAVLTLSPEADLIKLESNTVTCFETLIVNQMLLWPLKHRFTRSHLYTESQVGRGLAAFRDAVWAYLQVPPPRVSRPRQGEEIRLGVYARKHMWHREIVNMDEVAVGVVEAVREEGVKHVHITDVDELEGAHFACQLDPKKNPEFRDQVLTVANMDMYVGTHGGHDSLSLFLPRCATYLEIDSECGAGHWSPGETYSKAVGFRYYFQRGKSSHINSKVATSLVPKDYSIKFGMPKGSKVVSDCTGLADAGPRPPAYTYSPDLSVDVGDVQEWAKEAMALWMDETEEEWMRRNCDGEGEPPEANDVQSGVSM